MVHGFGCEAGAVEVLRRGYQRRYAGGAARRSSHQTSKGKKERRVSTLCFLSKLHLRQDKMKVQQIFLINFYFVERTRTLLPFLYDTIYQIILRVPDHLCYLT